MIEKKWIAPKIIIILIIIIPLINLILISVVHADTPYLNNLEIGTQLLQVKKYDVETWKNTVDNESTPSDWFGGDADKTGAKSKITLKVFFDLNVTANSLFSNMVIPQNYLPIYELIRDYGYGAHYIENHYPNVYEVWSYYSSFWIFTSKEFKWTASSKYSYIFKFPQDSSSLLNDYNNFSGIINNDTVLQSLNYSLPILSGDDLVLQLITKRLAVGNPKNQYLSSFINAVGCINATIQGNSLILQRYGEKSYSVEATYKTQGFLDNIIVKDSEGYIFYKISSLYPKVIFYILIGIISIFILGLITVVIIRK
ncbi:MAG: hypothetical protein ACFFE5_10380, partial [Candidatus Thorarchaeota archaeon]